MTGNYLTISLSTHNGDDTLQNNIENTAYIKIRIHKLNNKNT